MPTPHCDITFGLMIDKKSIRLNQIYIVMSTEVMSVKSVANYTGYAESYIYKLIHFRKIAYYKLTRKKVLFRKEDVDNFIFGNREATQVELEAKAKEFNKNKKTKAL